MSSGRKRAFDESTALNAAMEIFWQKGYLGASLSDLTKSMGINKPSLYNTFGNKETLFVKATQCYLDTKMKPTIDLLFKANVSLKQRLKDHMMAIVAMQFASDGLNNGNNAKGCYLAFCQSEIVSGDIPEQAEEILKKADEMPIQIYTELFNTDADSIKLGLNKHAHAHALSVYTILKGTASMARSGIDQAQLEHSIDSIISGIGIH